MNPVVFPDADATDGLTVYSETLSEFTWKNRLVGSTPAGFLYVDDRVAKVGFYEFHPKRLDWARVEGCKISLHVSLKGILLGFLLLALAVTIFIAGWVKKTATGPGVVMIPIVCGLAGGALVLGAVRNRMVVTTSNASYRWTSEPLSYRRTRSWCAEAADRCRAHGVPVTSHVQSGAIPA